MKHMRVRLSLIAAVALSALTLAGCEKSAVPGVPAPAGGGGGGAPAAAAPQNKQDAPAQSDPKMLISNAAKTTRESSSCKFEWKLDAKGGGDTGLGVWTSTGAMDFKANRSKIDSVLGVGDQKMTMSIISDGSTIYMRTVTAGATAEPWEKMDTKELEAQLGQLGGGAAAGKGESPGRDPMSFIDQIKEFATVTPDGSEDIKGVPTTRYKATVDPSKLPAAEGGGEGSMKLWLDAKNRLVRFQVGVSGDGSMTADFFDYDSPVKIDVPAPSEIQGGN
jgi:hypothetical protein